VLITYEKHLTFGVLGFEVLTAVVLKVALCYKPKGPGFNIR
jgi:hypothetical protein